MINVQATSNLAAFEQALVNYADQTGKTSAEALRDQGRLLLVRMVALTPPRNQKQGRDAIAKDMDAAIPLKTAEDFDSEQIQTLVREGRYETLNEVMRNSGSNLRFAPFESSTYMQSRNRRKRVDRRRDFRDQATLDKAPRARFLRQLQEGVGHAKGGWAHSLIKLGGRPARWITRHADIGRMQEGDEKGDPFIRFVNESGWAGSRDGNAAPQAVIDAALKGRARNIAQDIQRRQTRALRKQFSRASRSARRAVA